MCALTCDPLDVLFYLRITQKFINCVQSLAKLHFIVQLVQPAVALTADRNGVLQLCLLKVFFEVLATMQFPRNEVMSGQHRLPLA